jgi:glycoside hydrolase family 16
MTASGNNVPHRPRSRRGLSHALFAFAASATIAGSIVGAGGASPVWADGAGASPLPEAVRAQGYNKISFQDEFDGAALDASKWGYSYSCFDPGARTQAQYTDSPENVNVSGGNLHLVARYSPTREKWNKDTKRMETVDRTCTRTENGKKIEYAAPFTSAMIQTRDSNGNVKYAAQGDFYAEARIKLPKGRSSWASFWMTGSKGSWPGNGEIDAFESKGWDPHYLQANTHTPRASNPLKSEQHRGQLGGDGTSQSEFHTYGVEKDGDKITFYLDGVAGHTVKYADLGGANPFTVDGNGMVLRLNQMVGGTFLASDDGKNTEYVDATKYVHDYEGEGSDMLVDYVRVWEKDPSAPVSPSPTEPVTPVTPANPEPAPAATPSAPAPTPEPTHTTDSDNKPAQPGNPGTSGDTTPGADANNGNSAHAPSAPHTPGDQAGNTGNQGDQASDANKPAQPGNPGAGSGANKPAPSQPDTQPVAPGTAGENGVGGNTNTEPGAATQGKGEGHEQPFHAAQQGAGETSAPSHQEGAAGGAQGVGVHSTSALPSTGGNVLVVVAAAGALVAAAAVGLAALVVNRKSKRS